MATFKKKRKGGFERYSMTPKAKIESLYLPPKNKFLSKRNKTGVRSKFGFASFRILDEVAVIGVRELCRRFDDAVSDPYESPQP